MMKIYFETKEEAKEHQLKDFLALSPYERFEKFLQLSRQMKNLLPESLPVPKKDNFYITKKN